MKKLEILQELPTCDRETQNEQMLLEKWWQQTYFIQDCYKLSTCKNVIYAKFNKGKHNKNVCIYY